jgi:8-oxo-dGTP pyrophosphatase MutT (NUDIX family)
MYCNNCGEGGHVFKSCKDPIISCGILLLRGPFEPLKLPADPKHLAILMVKRKDSMAYMEFIRGKYEILNDLYIRKLISNMTLDEQLRISTQTFESLWTKLWGAGRDSESQEFEQSRDKYNSLDLKKLVQECKSLFTEPEWGFPKGRRSKGETDLICAIREFFEETNIPAEAYVVLPEFTFTETFMATNNVKYKHVYFVALLQDSKLFNLSGKLTPMQRREVSAVEWKSLKECKNIIRPHYSERKLLIEQLEKQVKIYSSKL